MNSSSRAFTLIEILVVISIIGILLSVVIMSFDSARESSRDSVRQSDLKELQLALEVYRAQNGYYPAEGCGSDSPLVPTDTPSNADWDGATSWTGPGPHSAAWGTECNEYIAGLVPDYISELPTDPNQEGDDNKGYIYRVASDGSAFKILVNATVEVKTVDGYDNEFARCPWDVGSTECGVSPQTNVYGVYSQGAESW